MNENECIANCNLCKRARCIYEDERRGYTVSQKCIDAYERRKHTMTDKQMQAIQIVAEANKTGIKNTPEYVKARQIVKYLTYRDKYLERKKAKYWNMGEA